MDKLSKNNLLQGTWLMAFAAVFSKILSASYRIPLQNLVGDHGYYVYQQIYWIYGIFTVLSLTGLPLLISKIFINNTKEELAHNITDVFWLLNYFSIGLIILLEIFAPNLARAMGDSQLTNELRLTALVYLFVPIEAVIRATYQSQLDVKISATSQIIEQVIRVTVIITIAILFTRNILGVYKMGALANSAAVLAAMGASLYLIFCYQKFVKTNELKLKWIPTFNKKLSYRLLLEGGSIILVTAILVLFQLIDSMTIVPNLIKGGLGVVQAGVQKGIFDRAQPLAQLGIVVVTSFLAILVPANELDNGKKEVPIITKMLHFCISFSVAETIGLIVLIKPINIMLFKDDKNSAAIAMFLVSVGLYSIINILVALNKKNYYQRVIRFLLVSLIVKWGLNELLVRPLGLMGASLATVISLAILLLLLLLITDQRIKIALQNNHFISKMILISIGMLVAVKLSMAFTEPFFSTGRLASLVIVFIGIIVGVIVFGYLTVKLNIFSKNELKTIPILKRIIK